MKNSLVLFLLFLLFPIIMVGQTAIEKQTVTNTSTLLDFASGTTKGLILPAVQTLPVSPANGTFLFDTRAAHKKIKMYENGGWVDLSAAGSTTALVPYSGTVDNGKKTIIGAHTTAADGVLVLESTNKALVLPKISNPHLTVKNPYPGMMCYDTNRKALAVFDGTVWNYWK